MSRLLVLSLFLLAVISTESAAQRTGTSAIPRQRIGVDANPKASSDYDRNSVRESISLMRSTPATNFHYAKVWSDIERVPGEYDLDDVSFNVERTAPLSMAFNLRILDAGGRNMPESYKGLVWDSPQMVERVIAVVERLAPVLGSRPWSYAIGNEIDLYFGPRPQEVPAYARMLQQVRTRIRTLHPNAQFTTAFQASAAPQLRGLYAPILATLDHVSITYYPLDPTFRVRPPQVVTTEIPALVAAAAPLPMYFQEIGYPSSPLLGSSPEAQASFVRLAYETIRSIGSPRVLGATYLFQADLANWVIEMIANAYSANTPEFRAFVGTLGLRDERDRPKPAWNEFIRQAEIMAPKRR